jgi:hypothetical protein
MRLWVGLVVVCSAVSGLGCNKKEAGPRPNPRCNLGAEASLREFCDQDDVWRDRCERYAHYDAALADMIADCGSTGFPVALGSCEGRMIERGAGDGTGTGYFYDEDGDLVGIRVVEDAPIACPEGSPGAGHEAVTIGGRATDERCETCHLCGVTLDDDGEVCSGESAQPYVQQCLDAFDFAPGCDECACGACYPWTFSGIEDTAREFHECVTDHCEVCAQPIDEDDGGSEPDGSSQPDASQQSTDEDAGR